MSLDIRLAWPVPVSLLQLHNQAMVQLDVMLTKRLCSNNARPSGSNGTLLTSFTLQLRRTVTRLSLDHFLSYRTPVILQSLQDSPLSVLPYTLRSSVSAGHPLPVLPYTLHPSVSAGQPTSCITIHPSFFSLCRKTHFLSHRTPHILQSLQDRPLPLCRFQTCSNLI